MSLWIATALVSGAWAATDPPTPALALHDGQSTARAIVAVVDATGLPESQLQPLSLADLRQSAPARLTQGGAAYTCAGAAQPDTYLQSVYDLNKRDRLSFRYDRVTDRMADFPAQLACLQSPPDPALLAAVWMESAFSMVFGDDHDAAQRAMQHALGSQPDLEWNTDTYPVDAAPLFLQAYRAQQQLAPVTLTIVPSPSGPLMLDGHPVETTAGALTLTPGLHILSADGVGGAISLSIDTDDILVTPAALSETALIRISSADTAALDAVLKATVEPGTRVLAVVDANVYEQHNDGWRPAEYSTANQAPSTSPAQTVRWTGVGVTAAGVALGAISYGQSRSAQTAFDAAAVGTAERDTARTSYEAASTRLSVGYALTGVGVLAFGGSYFMDSSAPVRVAPTFGTGGAGLTLSVTTP